MPVTREDLERWLGKDFGVVEEVVTEAEWADRRWRAEYLCQRTRLGRYHVHDAPSAQDISKRVVYFGVDK